MKQLFEEIQEQSEFIIFYKDSDVDLEKKVSVKAERFSVERILRKAFEGTDLTYQISDRQIVIIPDQAVAPELVQEVVQQPGLKTVSGVVKDDVGLGLPGVSVAVRGTSRGTSTDANGEFSMQAAVGDTLVFSFIGKTPVEQVVGDRNIFDVALYDDDTQLEEVQVVAFGRQKKTSVISSIETVRPADLKQPASNLTSALAGKIPGIISYSTTGEPGNDNAQFFIRGVTTFGYKTNPLILIDGFEASPDDLARMEPDNIESFSILKDASATVLYGARGANGIIIVETKSGREGPAKINIRLETHIATPTQMNELLDGV
ncbi:TonB-dependent receptor plug domain-containing protein, partial [uncultured Sunxiuqinia sp.]|uniref:SusC/RagA family TonB-linked outer membrane protein n=1 Tax=uncultured Sunxiuqinia sp. TaxID=1573825 RepID=UPI0030DB0B75